MNQPLKPSSTTRRLTPARVAILYAALALFGVMVFGTLLTYGFDDPVMQGRIELAKDMLFVLVTSILFFFLLKQWRDPIPVSYTHLDVYKRQQLFRSMSVQAAVQNGIVNSLRR